METASGCPFCGFEEPAVTVHRDDRVQAFVSLAPINRYHVLVTSHAHFEHLAEMPGPTLAAVLSVAQRMSAAIAAVARPDAITLLSDDDLSGAGFNQVACMTSTHGRLAVRMVADGIRERVAGGGSRPCPRQ